MNEQMVLWGHLSQYVHEEPEYCGSLGPQVYTRELQQKKWWLVKRSVKQIVWIFMNIWVEIDDNRPSRDFLAVWSLQSFGLLTFKFCEDEGDGSRMEGLKITDNAFWRFCFIKNVCFTNQFLNWQFFIVFLIKKKIIKRILSFWGEDRVSES